MNSPNKQQTVLRAQRDEATSVQARDVVNLLVDAPETVLQKRSCKFKLWVDIICKSSEE